MSGVIRLVPNDDVQLYKYDFNLGYRCLDYEISIVTDLETKYTSLISTTGDLEDSINSLMDLTSDEDLLDIYSEYKGDLLSLLRNTEYISFDYSVEEIVKYIKDEPILKTKKILFNDVYDLNPEMIIAIEKAFGNDTSRIYFNVIGNNRLINFKEYSETVLAINKMANEINRFDFSPLEKIMYAYDLVRSRVFKEVDENDDKMKSRTLSSVLLGDKIVCAGYTIVFKTLLKKLGIDANEIIFCDVDNTTGHVRNEIYVKDEKYGVDGVYYFDPTWDSKQSENDDSYLLSYKFFGITKSALDAVDKGKRVDKNFPYYSKHLIQEFQEEVDSKGFQGLSTEVINSINHMSVLILDKQLISKLSFLPYAPKIFRLDKNKIIEDLVSLMEYFNRPLSAEILLQVLFNVRKVQYYSEPQKYTLSMNDIFQIVLRSDWVFKNELFTKAELDKLSKEKVIRIKALQLKIYADISELDKNISQVRLEKVLRLVCEKNKT